MSFQPLFQTHEAGKTILTLAKEKLFPAVGKLKELAMETAKYRINICNSFFRMGLDSLQRKYEEQNRNFLALYHEYSTPDELFAEFNLDPEKDKDKIGLMMGDYLKSEQAIISHFQEGFKFLEIIDRQLTRYYQSADQRMATVLSISAITISIIVAIFK